MAEREQPKALVLLRIVADGLRDPIRHVKYPDEERCARCGGKWPCPNGAFDELREEIKRLADPQRQLRQAQERVAQAERRLGLEVLAHMETKAERDAATERAEAAEALVDRIDKIIAAPNERPAATKGYLAWAGLLTDVRLEIHKARKSAPAEAQAQRGERK